VDGGREARWEGLDARHEDDDVFDGVRIVEREYAVRIVHLLWCAEWQSPGKHHRKHGEQ
jgi:hypothetical protein